MTIIISGVLGIVVYTVIYYLVMLGIIVIYFWSYSSLGITAHPLISIWLYWE